MRMRMAQALGMAGLLVIGGMGCRKGSKDTDKVLANVAGEKITAGQFNDAARLVFPDEKKAEDLLKGGELKEQRNQFLETLALNKAVIRFAKTQSLDKDPKTKLMMEQAQARIYFQLLAERRLSKPEPTETQLQELYSKLAAPAKTAGKEKDVPPFEQAKERLKSIWKQQEQQKQEQTVSENLMKEVKQKYPVTFAEDYKPAVQAGQEAK